MKTHTNIDTLLIHGGIDGDAHTGAVNVPIYQTSTYKQLSLGKHSGYEYSRTGNPTRHALEVLIAELEGAKHGFAFASGMAATTAVLSLFRSGDKIVISSNVYGGTFRVLDKIFYNFGISYEIVETRDLQLLESKMDPAVKAVFIETPANPLMSITDIEAVSQIAKKHHAYLIVDNTFLTPYLQKPILFGADIVVHSATKYLGGHSDLVAGLAVVNDDHVGERLHFIQNSTGGVLPPFDSWLLIRGIKTLGVRMDRHMENAQFIAEFLQEHTGTTAVYYPGLKSNDGYTTNAKQANGAGGVISFVLSENHNLRKFFDSLELITLGESLGGIESLISHPASMTHASIPPKIRQEIGIVDKLVRLSVGLESSQDIMFDLMNAFEASLVNSI